MVVSGWALLVVMSAVAVIGYLFASGTTAERALRAALLDVVLAVVMAVAMALRWAWRYLRREDPGCAHDLTQHRGGDRLPQAEGGRPVHRAQLGQGPGWRGRDPRG